MPKEYTRITNAPLIKKLKKRPGYSVRFRIPAHDGKPRRWSRREQFPVRTKSELQPYLEEFRRELEREINTGLVEDKEIIFGPYAREWHENRKFDGSIKETTWDREEIVIKLIENSSLADIPIERVTLLDLDRADAELRKSGASNDKMRRFQIKCNQVLAHAKSRNLISINPAADRKITPDNPSPENSRRSLSRDESLRMWEEIKNSPKDGKLMVIATAYLLSYRRGECLGLVRMDFRLDDEIPCVDLNRQRNAKNHIVDPKWNSKGVTALDEEAVEFYREWFEIQSELYFNGGPIPDDFPVCCNDKGEFLNPSNFDKFRRKWFADHGFGTQKIEKFRDKNGHLRTKRTGFDGFNLHELRHTGATEMIAAGNDTKSVQEALRHKSIVTTEKYIHAVPENVVRAMNSRAAMRNKKPSGDDNTN